MKRFGMMEKSRKHSTRVDVPVSSPFREALGKAIDAKIAEWKRDGTIDASMECLRQCVAMGELYYLDGAPRGTNAGYYFAEIFREVVNASPTRKRFILSREGN